LGSGSRFTSTWRLCRKCVENEFSMLVILQPRVQTLKEQSLSVACPKWFLSHGEDARPMGMGSSLEFTIDASLALQNGSTNPVTNRSIQIRRPSALIPYRQRTRKSATGAGTRLVSQSARTRNFGGLFHSQSKHVLLAPVCHRWRSVKPESQCFRRSETKTGAAQWNNPLPENQSSAQHAEVGK
jgi:hypothetical protein